MRVRRGRRLIGAGLSFALALLGLSVLTQTVAAPSAHATVIYPNMCGYTGTPPTLNHVINIKMENQSWSDIQPPHNIDFEDTGYNSSPPPTNFEDLQNASWTGQGANFESAPFQNSTASLFVGVNGTQFYTGFDVTSPALYTKCTYATLFSGVTHLSTGNYFAEASGAMPNVNTTTSGVYGDCTTASLCTNVPANYPGGVIPANIYSQLGASGWKVYQEEHTGIGNCASNVIYQHRDIVKYMTSSTNPGYISPATCTANDIGVADLKVTTSNPFYTALQTVGTLPKYTDIVPDTNDMSEATGSATNSDGSASVCSGQSGSALRGCRIGAADRFLKAVVTYITASPQYSAGDTAVIVSYDEGSGFRDTLNDPSNGLNASDVSDVASGTYYDDDNQGQDCASHNKSNTTNPLDNIAFYYPSCHVPFFLVYPFAPSNYDISQGKPGYTLYSILGGIQQAFGLTKTGHAADMCGSALCNTPLDFTPTAPTLTYPHLCANTGTKPALTHVINITLRRESWGELSNASGYSTNEVGAATWNGYNYIGSNGISSQCGYSTQAAGASHLGATSYFAQSRGQYPTAHPGSDSTANCTTPANCTNITANYTTAVGGSIYTQLEAAGKTWTVYHEGMDSNCKNSTVNNRTDVVKYDSVSGTGTGYINQTTPSVYGSDCGLHDIGVSSMTSRMPSNQFWEALQTQSLPNYTQLVPSDTYSSRASSTYCTNQTGGWTPVPSTHQCQLWLQDQWLGLVVRNIFYSPQYQAGNTAIIITADEGSGYNDGGTDPANGLTISNVSAKPCGNSGQPACIDDDNPNENCSGYNANLPTWGGANVISTKYFSCQVPLYVVYPYTPHAISNNYYTAYSILKGIEDTFGLGYLGAVGATNCGSGGTSYCYGSWKGAFGT